MTDSQQLLGASQAWPLWETAPAGDAFSLDTSLGTDGAIVQSVSRPWLFSYAPKNKRANNRAIILFAGGGYVELMVGREGVQVARWFASLGFHAFVLVHRFPNKDTDFQAPIDDARQSLRMIQSQGFTDIGICGLSSGGHLGASLLATYPEGVEERGTGELPKICFAIIGYAPISTNTKGRQVVQDKPDLLPPEKQQLYNIVQPDTQLKDSPPPTFIVYSNNDPIVPVVNAYRLAEGLTKAGGSVELHVFADASHGFALDTLEQPVSDWPRICEKWLAQIGCLD